CQRILTRMLWAISPEWWVFYSGVVAGLGGNVFATRALSHEAVYTAGRMWLEFTVFVVSSAFGVAAGAVRKRVEERWRAGGGHQGDEEGFLQVELVRLCLYALGAGSFLVAALEIVVGRLGLCLSLLR